MSIEYRVSHNGHFIHAIVTDLVTSQELIEYEVAHAVDDRIQPPVSELLEIRCGALKNISKDDFSKLLNEQRVKFNKLSRPHRCAIVVHYSDTHAWDLAKFYETMATLHTPQGVIVFGDLHIAKTWLGIE
ncbi:MAG: hypothetical protein SWO11_01630 [Thermodesulfobacteriota bacterium]|nr:hypothetical protein [Thermodesulfobacteriota bacterium]